MKPFEKSILFPEEIVERKKPANMTEEDEYLFSHEFSIRLNNCFSYHYYNCYVTGRGLAVSRDRLSQHTIAQCISEERVSKKIALKSFGQTKMFGTVNNFHKAITFTDTNSHGYFHWLTDTLPKLLAYSNLLLCDYAILIPEKCYSSMVKETLNIIGIDMTQVFVIPNKKKVHVNKLWVIGHLAQPAGTGNYRPHTLQHTRDTIKSHIDKNSAKRKYLISKYGTRLFVSRKDAKYRYLVNEDEIEYLLRSHGFQTVYASEHNFEEQVMLFSQANIILGLHGAGLTNMIWMDPHTKVVEIRQKNDSHNNCYFSLASAMNLQYYYSLAETDTSDLHKANFFWNKNKAKALLKDIHA